MMINPFSALTSKIFGAATIALLLFSALCWHKWGVWKDKFGDLDNEAGVVLASIRIASGNPKLKWDDAAHQVDELDKSLTGWKSQAETLSGTVDAMGAETVRLRSENAALTAKVRALNARRSELIARLDQDALDPGDVADCWAQIREVDASLNKLREEGF